MAQQTFEGEGGSGGVTYSALYFFAVYGSGQIYTGLLLFVVSAHNVDVCVMTLYQKLLHVELIIMSLHPPHTHTYLSLSAWRVGQLFSSCCVEKPQATRYFGLL